MALRSACGERLRLTNVARPDCISEHWAAAEAVRNVGRCPAIQVKLAEVGVTKRLVALLASEHKSLNKIAAKCSRSFSYVILPPIHI